MKKIGRIAFILLMIVQIFMVLVAVNFIYMLKNLYLNFGILGVLISAGIIAIFAFHFFAVFPKKLRQIFPPIIYDDEIAQNKQEQAALVKLINGNKQKLIDDCYWGEIGKEEIGNRLDSIMREQETLKKCIDKYPPSSKEFTLHLPQSNFQRQNPTFYAVLILSIMLFAFILFFSSFVWLLQYYESPNNHDRVDNYETIPESYLDMDDTVYVSAAGKIHLLPDCSGMKSYDEMTYEEACEAGYEYCSRCFD